MEGIKKYKVITKHPKDEFIDMNVGVKLNSHDVIRILNEQDKRIDELELLLNADKKMEINSIKGLEKLKQENQQLKQSQKQSAVDKMTELYNLTDEIYHTNDMDKEWLLDWLKAEIWKLNQEIKKLKGEMCEKK